MNGILNIKKGYYWNPACYHGIILAGMSHLVTG
jgi:hypothetical protein